jgi:hypothetical protein
MDTAFDRIATGMAVTIELQNLGDAELCKEIAARIEHAFCRSTRGLASNHCWIAGQ